ncbi:MAG: hypothetical protein JKY42_08180 [Flavobacteriales bacterium]|nr:hypothetical protein [Flavobacteriales bacterium]
MKFLKPCSLLLTVLCCFSGFASGDNYHIGGRSAAMGNSSVMLQDRWSIHHNQAGLAWLEKKSVGVYYESRYTTSQLGLQGGAFILPTEAAGTFGLSISTFGYSLYNETKIGLAYARKLSPMFSVGIQLDYFSIGIGENYGRVGAFSGEIGVLAVLTDNLTVGAHLFNPSRTRIAQYNDEHLPTILRFGASYKFSDKVLMTGEMEKDIDQKPVFKSGLEYNISEPIFIRAGIASNPFVSSFGVGVRLKGFEFDIATSFHSVLGYTPQLSLGYTF